VQRKTDIEMCFRVLNKQTCIHIDGYLGQKEKSILKIKVGTEDT
jgi:hypothetical protein